MARIEKTVFICYRGFTISWALSVYQYLNTQGYDVFFDYQSISSDNFEEIITENIKTRAHFLVLMAPSSFERCDEPEDWFRREIETALDAKRNIVPVMLEGFDFSQPEIREKLTGKLNQLTMYNGIRIPAAYFFEGMERLCHRFLNVPIDTVLTPSPYFSMSSPNAEKQHNEPLKVFLCYASQDFAYVHGVYEKLKKDGFEPWLDKENILPGQNWNLEIDNAVENSDAVIVCLSKSSVNKAGTIQKEIGYVYEMATEKPEGTIYVIPIRLNDCDVPNRLRQYHVEDFFPANIETRAYERIKKSLLHVQKQKRNS